jgi:predicted DNA-binding transcriptional regulator AlpA
MEILLTTREVCELLRISRVRLWYHVRAGNIPQPVRISPTAHPRWRKSDIMALIERDAKQKAPAAETGAAHGYVERFEEYSDAKLR